jgi:tetratricopeptide (TPR) repeat protein
MARAAWFRRLILVTAPLALVVSHGLAEAPSHRAGQVHFPISCTSDAQRQFDRALAVLHSFWYEEAVKEFTAIGETDPGCAMAEWGVAMSLWYPLWYPPGEKALKAGADAVAKARALGAKTERERDYIEAIAVFYTDADTRDHRARSLAYEKAMEQLHLRYPEDSEAAVFYALALDATAPPNDKSLANQRKAAAILEKVHAEQPGHPGVAHYLIHSYDSPALAAQGLPAARSYAEIAPDVPHALHMPSHIFTRVGSWQESIASNERSAAVGQAYARETFGRDVLWDQSLHAMDYLEYAYLQTAQDVAAKRVVDDIAASSKVEPMSRAAAYAVAAVPARFALERRDWAQAASLSLPAAGIPWERFPWAAAMISYTRALGAARTGDEAQARQEIAKLDAMHTKLIEAQDGYWADQVDVQRRAATGMLAHLRHADDEAVASLRSAAELEASTEKSPVTPGAVVPARELLADLLLETGQPAEALRQYEATLASDPNRFRSVFGAAQAAERSGDLAKARGYYESVTALASKADTQRPELHIAEAFLAKP